VDGASVALGHDVHVIDTAMSGYSGITSAYVILGSRPCLVETGTATSAETVVNALRGLGIGPDELATIVVTHIHLDHAGGVGDLAEAFPRAEIVVHEAGARHLADPTRLLDSARRVFGSVLDDVFGLLRPTDPSRIRTLGTTGTIDLGDGRRLDAFHAPGHAKHHLGLVDSVTGDLYVGDAAGIYVQETADVRPSTPPPDFDLELAIESIHRFRDAGPTRLLFSHFGPVADIETTLARSEEELRLWVELVRGARRDHLDLDHAVARVREATLERYATFLLDPERVARYEHLNADRSNVVGINRWLDAVDAADAVEA
jgi:glyoxylase-like metal-dependent hydrolase (beta-lactamase superfamily II)